MARVPDLVPYAAEHGLKIITIAQLIEHRRRTERLIERGTAARLPDGHSASGARSATARSSTASTTWRW